ncbi:MAG: diphosphomevalonate decarboxylase [Gammaproteobacteria bacterium]|nr:diphosphomevalonate decarboxylase [Gammaproteobacteria bacterium]MBU1926526.1 diphosphomevalonate decarboxylase [Gammaproteobacteria bacterium]
MKAIDVVQLILKERFGAKPLHDEATAFAPANIALCKYWGKRDEALNLPVTSSLSISLNNQGATTNICLQKHRDEVTLNGELQSLDTVFSQRLLRFLDLFREGCDLHFKVDAQSDMPVGAGLASSACGFAALVLALNQLFGWGLCERELSILARLGSGSASRSLWDGFVKWHAGNRSDGMDSFAEHLPYEWPSLCVGLCVLFKQQKSISSREAMKRTVQTSPFYAAWKPTADQDLLCLEQAIQSQDFELLGSTAESNALAMHALILSSRPPILYSQCETVTAMHTVWHLRAQGLPVYFTQDAGANLKLLFLKDASNAIRQAFPEVEMIEPFG